MKIALKHQNTVKLFNGILTFEAITSFATQEFKVASQSVYLSYFDEEGDEISLCSNEDFRVLMDLCNSKPIVKIHVNLSDSAKGLIQINDIPPEKINADKETQILQEEAKQQQKCQGNPCKETTDNGKPATHVQDSDQRKWSHHRHYGRHGHHGHGHKHGHGHHGHHQRFPFFGHRMQQETSISQERPHFARFEKMHQFMNQRIAHQVDQRIKVLLPCLKSQLSPQNPIKLFSVPNALVHQKSQCKGCYSAPITGIRYKCLTCPDFSLCEACEATVQHPHNLLKMKFTEEDKPRECPFPFKKWGRHCLQSSSSSCSRFSSKSKDPQFWAAKKANRLSKLFGGKPEDYKQFVQAHKELRVGEILRKFAKDNNRNVQNIEDFCFRTRKCQKLSKMFGLQSAHFEKFVQQNIALKPRELVQKYAKENNISEDQLTQKRIAFKCEKLGRIFEKEPESFKSIVLQNLDLKVHQIKRLIRERQFGQGYEHPWAFKDCRFSNGSNRWWQDMKSKSKEKSFSPFLKKEAQKSYEKAERRCQKSNEKREIHQEKKSKSKAFNKDNIEKSNLLKVLVEYFGTYNVNEYYKLIEEHFGQGQEKIIQLYIDNHSK